MFFTPLPPPPPEASPWYFAFRRWQLTKELTEFAVVWGGAGCKPVTTDLRFFGVFIFVVFWAFIGFKFFNFLPVIEYFCQILLHLNVLLDI
jgi:hypothetical protein